MTDHDELRSLIAPFALGAVEPEEAEAVRAHLERCESCRRDYEEMSATVASLDLAVAEEELPPGFVQAVLAEARKGSSEAVRALRPRRGTALLAAAALVALLGVLGGWALSLRAELQRTQAALEAQRAAMTRLAQGLGGMRLEGAGQARALMLPTDSGGVFVASGLGEPPPEHVYQLWLLEDGQPISAGVFEVHAGSGTVVVRRPLAGVEGVAVTVEPEGGSEEPTGRTVLSTS